MKTVKKTKTKTKTGSRSTPAINWPTEEDSRWAARLELRLALDHGGSGDLAQEVLAEAFEAVMESGRGAEDLLGDPAEYAAEVAAERGGAEPGAEQRRGAVDIEGVTPGERFCGALMTGGALGAVLASIRWVGNGLWFRPGWTGLAVIALLLAVVLLIGAALALHAAGRLGGTRLAGGAVLLAIPLGALAATGLPTGAALTLPAPAVVAAALLLVAAGWMLPQNVVDRWFEGDALAEADDAAWLRRLEGLLRGRHGLSGTEARQHVTEARAHLAASGGGAHAEFGPVRTYALRLADGPRRPRRAMRRELWGTALLLPLVVFAGVDTLSGPDFGSPWTWVVLLALVYWACHAVWLYTRYRRAH